MSLGQSQFQTKIAKAATLKSEGNTYFKARQFEQARGKYQEALIMLDPNSFYGASEPECRQLAELSANLLNNVATCFFQEGKWKEADLIYSEAIVINPLYLKALFKRAVSRYELHEYSKAMVDIKKAYELDKTNPEVR